MTLVTLGASHAAAGTVIRAGGTSEASHTVHFRLPTGLSSVHRGQLQIKAGCGGFSESDLTGSATGAEITVAIACASTTNTESP